MKAQAREKIPSQKCNITGNNVHTQLWKEFLLQLLFLSVLSVRGWLSVFSHRARASLKDYIYSGLVSFGINTFFK